MTNLFPPNFLAFYHCLSFAPSVFILTTFSFSLGRAEAKAPWVLVFLTQTDSFAQSLNFRPSHLWGILLHKGNYMDVNNMLSNRACKHICSLCSLLRGRKRRETRLWANGKRSMRRGIQLWKTEWQKKWGHPQQKDRRYFKSFSEILCVLGGSNQALLAAIVTMPLGAALRLYKEGTCLPCRPLRNSPMVFCQLLAVVTIEAGERLGFYLSQLFQKRTATYEV